MIAVWEPNEEKWRLSFFLKTPRLLQLDFRDSGRSFHSTAPLYSKLRLR